jgi:hypothetical protein
VILLGEEERKCLSIHDHNHDVASTVFQQTSLSFKKGLES